MSTLGRGGLKDFRAMSFDCYGTLIDWQSGILGAMRPLLGGTAGVPSDSQIISAFAEHERRIESGPYVPYREVLRRVAGAMLGREAPGAGAIALPASLASWPAFPDTNPALQRLARRFPLAIASNVDKDLFAATRRRLDAPFAAVVTAEEVRSYKPAEAHFRELRRRLGVPAAEILHVAESRYHGVEPANRLGFGTVWINRTGGGASASGPGGGVAGWTFGSLGALADAVDAAFA